MNLQNSLEKAWNEPITAMEKYNIVPRSVLEEYIDDVAKVVDPSPDFSLKGLKIVYSPLHGTGAKFVPVLLRKLSAEVIEVSEQMV